MVDPSATNEHVGDELGGDGSAGFVLLVLAGVGEVGAVDKKGTKVVSPALMPHRKRRPQSQAAVLLRSQRERETYTTAVILLAEAIRRVWAMMQSLSTPQNPVSSQLGEAHKNTTSERSRENALHESAVGARFVRRSSSDNVDIRLAHRLVEGDPGRERRGSARGRSGSEFLAGRG